MNEMFLWKFSWKYFYKQLWTAEAYLEHIQTSMMERENS